MSGTLESLGRALRERAIELLRRSPLSHVPRGVALALSVLSVTLVLVALIRWWPFGEQSGFSLESATATTSPSPVATERAADADALQASAGTSDVDVTHPVTVHVAGAVANPGVYQVDEGARVVDAVEAAGGAVEGAALSSVNLARVLVDAEQIYIPTALELTAGNAQGSSGSTGLSAIGSGVSAGSGNASSTTPSDQTASVNINTATLEQLESLPGVGPSIAQRIVDDRETNGPFSSTKDLQRVSGIGEKRYASLADLICV